MADMNLTLHLPPDIEAKLRAQAEATGKAPEDIAVAALQEELSATDAAPPTLPLEQWLRDFDAWVADHQSRNPRVDDSRESIYPDRW